MFVKPVRFFTLHLFASANKQQIGDIKSWDVDEQDAEAHAPDDVEDGAEQHAEYKDGAECVGGVDGGLY